MKVQKLKELLNSSNGEIKNTKETDYDTEISGISFTSTKINPQQIFVAIKGGTIDGHKFVEDAFAQGAIFAVVEDEKYLNNHPGIVVNDSRIALAELANSFYEEPSSQIKTVGVTGTNGKTTTNWIVYHLLNLLGSPSIRLGTLGREAKIKDGSVALVDLDTLTTADPLFTNQSMREAINLGIESCVMEVSSHALKQKRTVAIDFDVAIFTNLTQDHLDYHPTFEDYYNSKKMLFEGLALSKKAKKTAVINLNCIYGSRLLEEIKKLPVNITTFGDKQNASIVIESIEQSISGSTYNLKIDNKNITIKTTLIGHHNAENCCAAIAACLALGYKLDDIINELPKVPQVPGRLESCGNKNLGIYVDYAHTPDALKNVLNAVRPIVENELWVIFGCGGDRDSSKRPRMAEIAVQLADKAVLTSDNPRTEDPESIINDALKEGHKPEIVEIDRRIAIKKTILSMKKGDVLVVAGKGHEDYQIIGTTKYPFSDFDEVQSSLLLSPYNTSHG